ncbi:MAG: xanthine dehydrogenase family protein molybdopterin-binding subunit [Deltaproteobacteria bacterium]|nr:xanthine dehydrogenase family protein molybdopterin-binding subunit [Deltaproteobacteria bacterium]
METIVGSPIIRVDAVEKVRGAAVYGTDVKLPEMLHGAVLRSPHAHARIVSIDVSAAKAMPGVRAVVTGEDLAGVLTGEAIRDMPFLAERKVRFEGEPVAAVAAEDEATARKAIRLIKVDYEELTPVVDLVKARGADAPVIHDKMMDYPRIGIVNPVPNTNIVTVNEYRKGNVEEGFSESDYVFENEFRTQMVQHGAIEPHCATAQMDASGKLTVWTTNDSPHRLRKDLSDSLAMPQTRIRVISTYVGGGFGSKGGVKAEAIAIALALKARPRPVKVVYDRREVFLASLVKHATVVKIKTGVKRDGTLMARDVEIVWDTGAYAEKGPVVCMQATAAAAGPYRVPHVHLIGYCVYTNRMIAGAYRGYGTPQLTWAYESQMDMIAQKIGLDPLEFRLRNVLREGDINPVGNVVHSVGIEACLKQAAQAIGWEERKRVPRVTPEGRYRGFGLACSTKNTKTPSGSGAVIYFNQDGRITIATASVEVGQGTRTVLAQVVAEVLGVPVDTISFSEPDTDFTPFDASTTSSRTTFHMGNALKMAAENVKKQFVDLGAAVFECGPAEIEVRAGRVWPAGRPKEAMTYVEVLRHEFAAGACVIGQAFYYPPAARGKAFHGSPSLFWMYGAHAAEVEVDPETGRVEVTRLAASIDVGRAINPTNCLQQIEGGALHGIGTTLFEDMVIDERGHLLNPNLRDYKMPTAMDAPEVLPSVVEAYHNEGPYGAKGMGEVVTNSAMAAIGSAVEDAVGVRLAELPLTAEKVYTALQLKRMSHQA